MTILCSICDSYIEITSNDRSCEGNYIFLCGNCLLLSKKNQSIISYTSCNSKYSLNKEDLLRLKHVYIHNLSNNTKYYIFAHVHQVIKDKYVDLGNFNKIVNRKHSIKEQKLIKKQYEIDTKTNEINNILKKHSLSFSSNNIQKYVESFDNQDYNTIILMAEEEKNIKYEKEQRQNKLVNKLNKYQLPYNPSNLYCQDYINRMGTRKLDEVITHIALENYKNLIF